MRKIFLIFGLAITLSSVALSAGNASRSEQISQAMDLYEHGLFYEAAQQFSEIAKRDGDAEALGYAILCRVTLRAGGYEQEMEEYLDAYPSMPVSYKIIYRYALNRFDDEAYAVALRYFNRLKMDNVERSQYTEFSFKQAYCNFELNDYEKAAEFVGKALASNLSALSKLSGEKLRDQRYEKFRAMGQFLTVESDDEGTTAAVEK